jgi:hypothetical protein
MKMLLGLQKKVFLGIQFFGRGSGWVGLGLNPESFIFLVKPETEPYFSMTYLIIFSSSQKPEPKVQNPSPTRALPGPYLSPQYSGPVRP